MFNFYTHLKRVKEEEIKNHNEIKEKKVQEKRKKDINKYVEGYENRIKDFVYDMAKSPIKIKDHNKIIYSSRQELLEEECPKILANKGFIFNQYKTEKQRIEEYLKEKEKISLKDNMLKLNNKKLNSISFTKTKTPLITRSPVSKRIVQPTMRFKARTDLERIYDAINSNSYGRVDKVIIEKQLRGLDLNVTKKLDEENDDDDEINERILSLDTDGSIDNKKKCRRKKVDNSHARHLMSDLHHKTHFKGAFGYTLFKDISGPGKNPTYNHDNKYINTDSNHTNFLSTDHEIKGFNTITNNSQNSFFNPIYTINTMNTINTLNPEDILNHETHSFNFNFNPYKKKEEDFDSDKLEFIRKLAYAKTEGDDEFGYFFKNKKFKSLKNVQFAKKFITSKVKKDAPCSLNLLSKNSEPEFDFKKSEDEKILIAGEEFVKTDLDKITKMVLTKCNFTHTKSKNNKKMHRMGDGKMMFTSGLTVKDFIKKFHLK